MCHIKSSEKYLEINFIFCSSISNSIYLNPVWDDAAVMVALPVSGWETKNVAEVEVEEEK